MHKKNTHRLWTSAQKADKKSVFVVECNVNGLVYLNRIDLRSYLTNYLQHFTSNPNGLLQ